MKKSTQFLRAFFGVLVLLTLIAGCSGGVFIDHGNDDGGSTSSGGGGGKPSKLSGNASYQDAIAKLDEIIAYASNNSAARNSAETAKKDLESKGPSQWSFVKGVTIDQINNLINGL